VETLEQPGAEDDKRSCIELLTQIDPKNVGEVLAPILEVLPPALQRQSLETMLQHPNPAYLEAVRSLSHQSLPPEVLALALRYIWLTDAEPNIDSLRPYLQSIVDPVVRGTAAALIMRRGDRQQKAEATNTLRQMLTHKQERERVMGTQTTCKDCGCIYPICCKMNLYECDALCWMSSLLLIPKNTTLR
jgi:hypothetical protein